ncbi:MAG: hypothetical protein ACI841_001505, partial [Planctomycetota bacterium]
MLNSRQRMQRNGGHRREGFALMTVLFVLLAMLVMCTPFLMTAKNADRASVQATDRSELRLALDSAGRHARSRLTPTYQSEDITPYFDTEDELLVDNLFASDFMNANDGMGLQWDLDVTDIASYIDLSSASPQVIANLLGMVALLPKKVGAKDSKIPLSAQGNFAEDGGMVWIAGELITYESIEKSELRGVSRGVRTWRSEEWNSEGPRPPSGHGLNVPVIDQRACALADWRLAFNDGALRAMDSEAQLDELQAFMGKGSLTEADLEILRDNTSVFGGVRGGQVWQRPERIIRDIIPGDFGVQYVEVQNPRWFGIGATVMVTDGESTEMRFVTYSSDAGVLFNKKLENRYYAGHAMAYVLSKRPVNINTAPATVLEAIFLNLRLAGQNRRIQKGAARDLAGLVIESRPFIGHEDFLRRIVLPAAGLEELPANAQVKPLMLEGDSSIIDLYDAKALYYNALNANDARLAFGTMPFCYTTRDVYQMELRASVSAETGVERTAAVRERVELLAPQKELFYMWARQEDFDEAFRLNREAPWWTTGPNVTTRYDNATVPPSRFLSHMGFVDGAPVDYEARAAVEEAGLETNEESPEAPDVEHIFADREDLGYAQLWPSRPEPRAPGIRARVDHFDYETTDPEGRYLPDETIQTTTDLVGWNSGDAPLMRAMHISFWIKPRQVENSTLFDVGNASDETDRLSMTIEDGYLVLRLLDGYGDHPGTAMIEASEVRFSVGTGDGPGLPTDIWSHITVDVCGNRPDQMSMLVNGMVHGVETPGMTRLTGQINQGSGAIPVESTEGFPPEGVLRIGNELVEYGSISGDSFVAVNNGTGFGGRLARERWDTEDVPVNIAEVDLSHGSGTPVMLYGYSLALASDIPAGGSEIEGETLGPFAVCRIVGVDDNAQTPQGDLIEAGGFIWGGGIEADTAPIGLELALADDVEGTLEEFTHMSAFNATGGYAAIIQRGWRGNNAAVSGENSPLGGIEIVAYSGYTDNMLHVERRGIEPSELPPLEDVGNFPIGGGRAFVFAWNPGINTPQGEPIQTVIEWGTHVIPISIRTPGISDLSGFLVAENNGGTEQFASITHVNQPDQTEWVAYDYVSVNYSQLVRCHPNALMAAYDAIVVSGERDLDLPVDPPGGPGGPGDGGGAPGTGGPGQPGGSVFEGGGIHPQAPPGIDDAGWLPGLMAGGSAGHSNSSASPNPPAAGTSAGQSGGGANWEPVIGKPANEDQALTLAVLRAFEHRGVYDTHSTSHEVGTPILPCFYVFDPGFRSGRDGGLDLGRPGARDHVFLSGPEADHIGWPLTIHRAYSPRTNGDVLAPDVMRPFSSWEQEEGLAVPTGQLTYVRSRLPGGRRIYVSMTEEGPEPIARTGTYGESRLMTRIVKFPSGERPRIVQSVGVGTGYDGSGTGVPSALIDELVFGAPRFGRSFAAETDQWWTQGAQLELQAPIDEAVETIYVDATSLRTPAGLTVLVADMAQAGGEPDNSAGNTAGGSASTLQDMHDGGGLLRIGEEILAYESWESDGTIEIARGGRGLLGSEAQSHSTSEAVTYLESMVATTLAGQLDESDNIISVLD